MGQIIGLVDETGTLVVKYTYDSWGVPKEYLENQTTGEWEEVPVGTFGNFYLYKGYYYDVETGLYYLNPVRNTNITILLCKISNGVNARYYDPTLGRFITRDPDGGNEKDRLSLNPYLYVKNNPINDDDPSGLLPWWLTKKGWREKKNQAKKEVKKIAKNVQKKIEKTVKKLTSKVSKAIKSVSKAIKSASKTVKKAVKSVSKQVTKAGNTLSKAYSSSPGGKAVQAISKSPTVKSVAKAATAVFDKITGTGRASAWQGNVHEGTPGGPRYKNENTYSWAKEVGFTSAQAKTIAKANMDVDRAWLPWQKGALGGPAHFDWIPGSNDSRDRLASQYLQDAKRTGNVEFLGAGLHSIQDKYSHRGLGTPFPSLLTLTPFYALGPAQISHLYLSARGRSPDDAASHPQGIARTEAATKAYLETYLNDY